MENKNIYKWILIKEDNSWNGQWTQEETPKPLEGYDWIQWNKPLPEDIGTLQYIYNSETSELESN